MSEAIILDATVEELPTNLPRLVMTDLDTSDSLSIVRVPIAETALLVEGVSRQKLDRLTASRLKQIAQRLISLVQFDFTPTAAPLLPIRVDTLLDRILQQPTLFVTSYLRRVTEWFGLEPNPAIHRIWFDLAQQQSGGTTLPQPLHSYQQRGLAVLVQDHVFIPTVVLAASRLISYWPEWNALPDMLHKARHALLRSEDPGTRSRTYYDQIVSFLLSPHPSLEGAGHRTTRARGELVDLHKLDWEGQQVENATIEALLVALERLSASDTGRYRRTFNEVHGRLWDNVLRASQSIGFLQRPSVGQPTVLDASNWHTSCRTVSSRLASIGKAYAVLTDLEQSLGVDRYMGSNVIASDLDHVHASVKRIRDETQTDLAGASELFLRQWNLSQVAPLVLGILGIRHRVSGLSDYFPNDHQRVVFLLIDALGYAQFQWFLDAVAQRAASPLGGNILVWLRDHASFNDTYLLASNLVSVTGTCLPTIYTGALPRETGITGSRMLMEGAVLNVLHGQHDSFGRQALSPQAVADIYRRNTNQNVLSLVDVARQCGAKVGVFHGGQAKFSPLLTFTYGKQALNTTQTRIVPQADRVFTEAVTSLATWPRSPSKQQLVLLYYPLIDSSGHPCGPYTQFQAMELSRLNFLLTHFLIDLVNQCEDYFDGRTSVVITADHGMFESSSTIVSEQLIRTAAQSTFPPDARIIFDNRACHVYGLAPEQISPAKDALGSYFAANGLPIRVTCKGDLLLNELLFDPTSPYAANCPDMILQFYGPGVFYRNERMAPHMFLYGAHGGRSVDEVFVPLIHFSLTPELASDLRKLYL